MDDNEWVVIAGVLEQCWAREWVDATGPMYRLVLDDFPAVPVLEAIKAIAGTGQKFRPSVGEIVGYLIKDVSELTWAEVESSIFGKRGVLWRHKRHGSAAVIAAAEDIHPFLGAFVSTQGVQRLSEMNVDDPDHGGAILGHLHKVWDEFVLGCRDRQQRGLPLPEGGREGRRGLPGRINALGLIPERRVTAGELTDGK